MTVEKVKKSGKNLKKAVKAADNFRFFDNLIEKIDTLESEEQVPELFEEEELLKESFKSLLSLMDTEAAAEDAEEDFDCEKVDEKVMEIMTKFLEEEIIDEEEFEDFFTEELAEEEDDDEDISEDNSEDISDDMSDDEEALSQDSEVSLKKTKKKMTAEEKQKAKNLKELEMLMEKVDNESDFETEESEQEEEDGEEDEKFDNDSSDKLDIFGEDKVEGGRLSSFEKSQLALKNEIATLEAEQVESQKPWALRGEINARQRPSDSLLEEAVDFDNLSRPTPQITEERTEEIEEIIKRRIGEAAWDDVERKDGRDLTLLNGMQNSTGKPARALLEDVATAQPQRSLTQVYEDVATEKLTGSTPKDQETLEKQSELTAMFAKICRHVDGLSGNRFAPKVYVQSDFQIKTLGAKK